MSPKHSESREKHHARQRGHEHETKRERRGRSIGWTAGLFVSLGLTIWWSIVAINAWYWYVQASSAVAYLDPIYGYSTSLLNLGYGYSVGWALGWTIAAIVMAIIAIFCYRKFRHYGPAWEEV